MLTLWLAIVVGGNARCGARRLREVRSGNAAWRREVVTKAANSADAAREARLSPRLVQRDGNAAARGRSVARAPSAVPPDWGQLVKRVFGEDGRVWWSATPAFVRRAHGPARRGGRRRLPHPHPHRPPPCQGSTRCPARWRGPGGLRGRVERPGERRCAGSAASGGLRPPGGRKRGESSLRQGAGACSLAECATLHCVHPIHPSLWMCRRPRLSSCPCSPAGLKP